MVYSGKLFDYVHLRGMTLCFLRPKALVQTIFDNLKPGGWVEFQDYTFDDQPANDTPGLRDRVARSASKQAVEIIRKGLQSLPGHRREVIADLEQWKGWLKDVGFVDIDVKIVLCPMNPWSSDPRLKEIGQVGSESALSAVSAMSQVLVAGGWSEIEVEELQQRLYEEHHDPTYQAYMPL